MSNNTSRYNKHLIALAISGALLGSHTAIAQTKAKETQETTEKKKLLDLERIVVTGSGGRGQTKLESSVSVTTLNAEQLAREAPLGTADLLESVPGFWVEDSGGKPTIMLRLEDYVAVKASVTLALKKTGYLWCTTAFGLIFISVKILRLNIWKRFVGAPQVY